MDNRSNLNSKIAFRRVALVVLIGLAMISTALKELGEAQAFVTHAAEIVSNWSSQITPTASARSRVTVIRSVALETCDEPASEQISSSEEFRWSGPIAPGQTVEVKGINGAINAESASSNEIQLVATKTSRQSDVSSVEIKVVQHAGGVTICALYPTESGEIDECLPSSESQKRSGGSIRKNDVRVDFNVKVPARVAFAGKTVNGDIAVNSLSSNVAAKTVNGSIKISTTGFAEASTVNGQISARLGDAQWSKALNFKTVNGTISLDLPANASADIEAQTLNGHITSDFPINMFSVKDRKHLRGRIGVGGRELFLKTVNGSIQLRLAG